MGDVILAHVAVRKDVEKLPSVQLLELFSAITKALILNDIPGVPKQPLIDQEQRMTLLVVEQELLRRLPNSGVE